METAWFPGSSLISFLSNDVHVLWSMLPGGVWSYLGTIRSCASICWAYYVHCILPGGMGARGGKMKTDPGWEHTIKLESRNKTRQHGMISKSSSEYIATWCSSFLCYIQRKMEKRILSACAWNNRFLISSLQRATSNRVIWCSLWRNNYKLLGANGQWGFLEKRLNCISQSVRSSEKGGSEYFSIRMLCLCRQRRKDRNCYKMCGE